MNDFLVLRLGDYVAWAIGVIAIVIAVAIYKRQEKVNKKIDNMKKSTIDLSLGRIGMSLNVTAESFDSNIEIVKIAFGDEEHKLATAKLLMKNSMKSYLLAIARMEKESDFLKGKIEATLHTEIEQAIQLTKNFATDEIPNVEFGILQALEKWSKNGNDIIKFMDETREAIEKLLD